MTASTTQSSVVAISDDYDAALAQYEDALAEYLLAVADYEDAAQAALDAKEALEQLTSEEACDDSSAYDAALAAYQEAQDRFKTAEAKYAALEEMFGAVSEQLAEIGKPYQAYYAALDAQTAAQDAADAYNALVDQLSDLLADFPEIDAYDSLLEGDPAGSYYKGKFEEFSEWMGKYEVLMPQLQAALDTLVTAADAFETANDAYNASGIAPAGNPTGSLVDPSNFEAVAEAALAQIEGEVEEADEQISAYQAMLAATLLFAQQYADYAAAVKDANEQVRTDLDPQFLCLAPSARDLTRVGLPAGYDLNVVATEDNFGQIFEGYKQYTSAAIDEANAMIQDAVDMSNNYIGWQHEYRDALAAFNAATGQSNSFTVDDLQLSLPNIEDVPDLADTAYNFNVNLLEGKFSLINGTYTLDDLLSGGNWLEANSHFEPRPSGAPTIAVPGFELNVSDIDGVSLLDIIAPADAPEPPSALPEPVEPIAFEAPTNPCTPTEPPTGPTEPSGSTGGTEPGDGSALAVTGAHVGGIVVASITLLGAGMAMVSRRSRSAGSLK